MEVCITIGFYLRYIISFHDSYHKLRFQPKCLSHERILPLLPLFWANPKLSLLFALIFRIKKNPIIVFNIFNFLLSSIFIRRKFRIRENFRLLLFDGFTFLLSSIYIRRKYLIRENFRLPVFDLFTCFEMS